MATIYKLMAKIFNHKAAAPGSKSGEIISMLRIKKGYSIADIGSGGGYFTLEFARRAGKKGKVYAVDTNRHFLKYIAKSAEREEITNITTVWADNLDSIPLGSLNMVFLRNVYHHIPAPEDYFDKLRNYLRKDGRVVIVDYKRRKGVSIHRLFGHYVDEGEVETSLKSAGYKLVKKYSSLPDQEFLVFELKQ